MSLATEMPFEDVEALLHYDAESGRFFWKKDVGKNVKAGSEAGCVKATRAGKDGRETRYRYIKCGEASYPAARLAWLLHYGEWPVGRIRSKDGDPLNTRIENLEETNSIRGFRTPGSNADYMQAHRAKFPAEWKDSYLRQKFSIGLDEYLAMAIAQENRCAICGGLETETRGGNTKALAVDHCHKTGAIRGLLCSSCNTGIGKFRDDVTILESAIAYLQKHENLHKEQAA